MSVEFLMKCYVMLVYVTLMYVSSNCINILNYAFMSIGGGL